MDPDFIAILQKLIAEQGRETLFNPTKSKALLADYTRNEYKKESRFLSQALDVGVQKAIDTTENIAICKLQQIRLLHEDYGLDEKVAVGVVDTLALVLRGDTAKTEIRKEEPKPEKEKQGLPEYRERIAKYQKCISVDCYCTVGLKADGTMVAVGDNRYGQCDTGSWRGIVAIVAGFYYTVGLKADGTVVAVGNNTAGQRNTGSWRNIVAIAASSFLTIGLKADGTVIAVGENDKGQCDTGNWRGIVAVAAGGKYTVGLKVDGTVVAVGYNEDDRCNTKSWQDIVAIASGSFHTVGLKADGTVVAVGSTECGRCNTENWRNIVAIAAEFHTVGLKADGTVVAVGNNPCGQCYTGSWRDIVAIAAGSDTTVGLKADGTVVAVGENVHGQCNTGSWRDIVAISACSATVGLKADGTVVVVGKYDIMDSRGITAGYCDFDVSSWRDIIAIAAGGDRIIGLKADGMVVGVDGKYNFTVDNWREIGPVPEELVCKWKGLCKSCGKAN